MLKKLIHIMLVVLVSTTLMLTGCGPKNVNDANVVKENGSENSKLNSEKKVKVGFVYIGSAKDLGWSYTHDQGRLYVQEKLGVETAYREFIEEGPAVEKAMQELIDDEGCNIIFATSYGYMDYVEKMAQKYPEVTFLHCSGNKTAANMGNYFGRIEEPRYLSGIVAGMQTKSDIIGYVAAHKIPEVIRGINAFTLGVRSVNPDAKVIVKWTNTWFDPVKEQKTAEELLALGADIITQHQDTEKPLQAAEAKGALAIGYHVDMQTKAPKAYLTAPVWNWGPYYAKQVQAVMNGTWKPESYWGGMNDDIVKLAPMSDLVSENIKAKVKEAEDKIMNGTLKLFSGPIKDQKGVVKVAAGQSLTDQELLGMLWFVEGVEGEISSGL